MRKTFCAALAAAILGGGGWAAGASSPMAVNSAISGTGGVEYKIWTPTSPTTLGEDNSLNTSAGLTGIVGGNAGAVGGNVELFANSETGISLLAFAAQPTVSLVGTAGGHTLTIRSLSGADWFANPLLPTYGASDRANAWFSAFTGAYGLDAFLATNLGYNPAQILAEKQALFAAFVVGSAGVGGFQRMSDPNIGYAYFDDADNQIHIGLEGSDSYLDGIVAGYVISKGRPDLVPLLPTGINASETVMVSIDGGPAQALWSFTGTPTGLVTNDSTESYTINFDVATPAPEPATVSVLILGAGALVLRRRK